MNEWINVEDRLPDTDSEGFSDDYLVIDNRIEIVNIGRYWSGDPGYLHPWADREEMELSVTHWMPLPDPPKVEDEKFSS